MFAIFIILPLFFEEKDSHDNDNSTVEGFLEKDLAKAEKRRSDLYRRATLMLVSGIIMAFIGISLFYSLFQQLISGRTIFSWPRAIGATSMFFFIESVAWFLLHQYRALIEDYKTFNQLCIERADYLAVLKIISKEKGAIKNRLTQEVSKSLLSAESIIIKPGENSAILKSSNDLQTGPK